MSNAENDQLMEDALFFADYFTGTMIGKALQVAIDQGDLDNMSMYVTHARTLVFEAEYRPDEVSHA